MENGKSLPILNYIKSDFVPLTPSTLKKLVDPVIIFFFATFHCNSSNPASPDVQLGIVLANQNLLYFVSDTINIPTIGYSQSTGLWPTLEKVDKPRCHLVVPRLDHVDNFALL